MDQGKIWRFEIEASGGHKQTFSMQIPKQRKTPAQLQGCEKTIPQSDGSVIDRQLIGCHTIN